MVRVAGVAVVGVVFGASGPEWHVVGSQECAPMSLRSDTATTRRQRLVVAVALTGTGLLGASLSTEPDSTELRAHVRSRRHLAGRRTGFGAASFALCSAPTNFLSGVSVCYRSSPAPLRSVRSSALHLSLGAFRC